MKTCPLCGFEGELERCPNDGEPLLTEAEYVARRPMDPTQAPPVERTQRAHATAATAEPQGVGPVHDPDDEHAGMRGENFGEWEAPEVARKPKTDPLIGQVLAGRYEVLGLLGKGGMGAVYKARQPSVQRTIALKVLLQEFAENETVIKRFHQEALAASRLQHPNTITVYDFGRSDEGILFIAMEYLRGESLADALRGGKGMSPRRVLHIMKQVCKSLSEAHRAEIIHRDLKPDNIFLTEVKGERDFVKVLDFGVAKLKEYEGKEGTLTQAGMIFGTPKYMSPEQARSGDLDARSDIYALGIILYEMLIGRPPFVGDNPLSILIAHVNEFAKPFAQARPDAQIPSALEAVVFKALAKEREHRQADVDELLNELEAVEALLDGAPYESVADRLPLRIAGHGESPSLVGPAIVPHGTDSTAHGLLGGDTRVLSGGSNETTPLGLGEVALDDDRRPPPRRGQSFALVLAGAIPVIGLGAWLILRSPDPESGGVALAGGTATLDAAASRGPADAQPPAPTPDAAVAAARVDAARETFEFFVVSQPPEARIVDPATGESLGISGGRVAVTGRRDLILRKGGYRDLEFTLDPALPERSLKLAMKPKPEAAKPRPPPKQQTITVTQPADTKEPVKKIPAHTTGPIDLE